jgi:hypothetical protein
MLRKSESKVIGEYTYNVTQLGAVTGSKVFLRVLKVLGPLVGAKDVGALFDRLKEEDFTYLCEEFAKMSTVQLEKGAPQLNAIFDVHFAGKYGELIEWLRFCIEVNFGEVLKGDVLKSVGRKAAASESTGPSPLTGMSGG